MVVQHNLIAMNSNRMLNLTVKSQSKSTEKLSSGYKINRAADDAAGLSISEKMRKQIRGLTQASANAQDGISMVQTAEGALSEVQDMLQRMNELAVKSANGTLSSDDRSYIQNEVDQIMSEIDRVRESTKFNETYLLKGETEVNQYMGFKGKLPDDTYASTGGIAGKYAKEAIVYTGTIKGVYYNNGNPPSDTYTGTFYGATIDLSSYTSQSQVEKLIGAGVSITCATCVGYVCLKFTDGTDASVSHIDGVSVGDTPESTGLDKKVLNSSVVNIGIGNCKTGEEVVSAVRNAFNTINGNEALFGNDLANISANKEQTITIDGVQSYVMSGITYDSDSATLSNTLERHMIMVICSGSKLYVGDPRTTAAGSATAGAAAAADTDGTAEYKSAIKTGVYGQITEFNPLYENCRLQVGADATSANGLNVKLGNLSTLSLGLANWDSNKDSWSYVDVLTQKNSLEAIKKVATAIQRVSTMRSDFGAIQNRLEHTINNLDNVVENTTSAESQIRDTDMATEMVRYSNNNILAQAGQSMLAQANQSNQSVLSLLG